MNSKGKPPHHRRPEARHRLRLVILLLFAAGGAVVAQNAVIVGIEGSVTWIRAGADAWQPATTNLALAAGDRLRTGPRSRATVQFSDRSVKRLAELTTFMLEAPEAGGKSRFQLDVGRVFFKSWERPGEIQFRTRTVSGAVRGTEFHLEAAEDGSTVLTLLDGAVDLENAAGRITLESGAEATVAPGLPPRKAPVLQTQKAIQWCLYYPGVLDVDELPLNGQSRAAVQPALDAYRAGDLKAALTAWPSDRVPASPAERVLRAALLLSVGNIREAQALLADAGQGDERAGRLADALRQIIAVAQLEQRPPSAAPSLATEWLAESYRAQSESNLAAALAAARKAAAAGPTFGFAHERIAELEFGFARTDAAQSALRRALELSPRNAQAVALQGFLASAADKLAAARDCFDRAIALDPALGNAWLGRGLVKIRQGETQAGRADLQVAAALEPNRALLRSYLGKALQHTGEPALAKKELGLARKLDPGDPTAPFYSALIHRERNEINAAVRELERSLALNDNRSVYRSRLLLDQDRAVRGANLAGVYRDAGLTEVSTREAARAVQSDYANYSAHLFLANSFDPRLLTARYETPAFTEYLVANLLAPVSVGGLSRNISQQEYSRFFETDLPRAAITTDYLSRGEWEQTATIYGNTHRFGYVFDVGYRSAPGLGTRPNNDLESLSLSAQFKFQLTPADTLYVQTIGYESRVGDLGQYYRQSSASTTVRVSERQDPIVLAGLHHEWAPGVHSLLLTGRLVDDLTITDSAVPLLLLGKNAAGDVTLIATPTTPTAPQNYLSAMEVYTVELQQLFQQERHGLIFGGRFQRGDFDTVNNLGPSTAVTVGTAAGPIVGPTFSTPATAQSVSSGFERLSLYAYHNWTVADPLQLTLGGSYDRLHFPENFRSAPISSAEGKREQFSPKAALIWTPWSGVTVRAAWSRSLGGVSYDQSIRLEPSQLAGFNQTYRGIISESIAGPQQLAFFESWGTGVDWKLSTGTYLGVEAELLHSEVSRRVGAFDLSTLFPFGITASSTPQRLDYFERSLAVNANQLVGEHWTLGARYKLTDADLNSLFPSVPSAVSARNNLDTAATLHQLTLFGLFHHRCGFFARGEALWWSQSNRGFTPAQPGDDFWQANLVAGYRLPRRQAELSVGLLNLTGQDYQLNPLTLHSDLLRERTLAISFKCRF